MSNTPLLASIERRNKVLLHPYLIIAEVGKLIAKRAIEKGAKEIIFDRGGYLYHGRVKALADAAREHGLVF